MRARGLRVAAFAVVMMSAGIAGAEVPAPPPIAATAATGSGSDSGSGSGTGSDTGTAPTPAPPAAPPSDSAAAAAPPLVPPPTVAPAPVTTTVTYNQTTPASAVSDDYYQHGVGMLHNSRLVLGVLSGTAPDLMEGVAPVAGMTKSTTMASLAFDAVWLGLPSSFGHFHGVEISTGVRTGPSDFWLSFGTAVSLLNIGDGGPLSLRLGGSFGLGFNLAHGYAYLRGRAAVVLIPGMLDAEVSVQWTPPSASTSDFDERTARLSVWYRRGTGQGAFEVYVEQFHRLDALTENEREFDGLGGGIGFSPF